MRLLPSEQALNVMGDLIRADQPQTIVMSVSWPNLVQAMNNKVPPLLADLTADIDISSGGSDADRALRESLIGMELSQRTDNADYAVPGLAGRHHGAGA